MNKRTKKTKQAVPQVSFTRSELKDGTGKVVSMKSGPSTFTVTVVGELADVLSKMKAFDTLELFVNSTGKSLEFLCVRSLIP